MSLKTQEVMAKTYQDYETLRLVVNEALGGTKSSGAKGSSSSSNVVTSFAELQAAFLDIGGVVGG